MQKVLNHVGIKNDPILKLAMELEKIALKDKYFIEKKLYPNVDLFWYNIKGNWISTWNVYCHICYCTTAGWTAQWTEMIEDPIQKIGRPRQLYTGKASKVWHKKIKIPDSYFISYIFKCRYL